jgi:hypothetical protein
LDEQYKEHRIKMNDMRKFYPTRGFDEKGSLNNSPSLSPTSNLKSYPVNRYFLKGDEESIRVLGEGNLKLLIRIP